MELLKQNADILLKTGKMLLKNWHACNIHHYKEARDICTNLDLEAELMILRHLRKHYPDFSILSEESGLYEKKSDYLWIVDPIDGSRNYFYKLPFFNITIALQHKNKTIFGIVYSPVSQEFFYAIKNKGGFCIPVKANFRLCHEGKKRIEISKAVDLKTATLHTESPLKDKKRNQKKMIEILNRFFVQCHRLRSIGSGALALAYTAQGSYDGYINFSHANNLWDIAAGVLLLEEAGGIASDFEGKSLGKETKSIIAANPLLHKQILDVLIKQ